MQRRKHYFASKSIEKCTLWQKALPSPEMLTDNEPTAVSLKSQNVFAPRKLKQNLKPYDYRAVLLTYS